MTNTELTLDQLSDMSGGFLLAFLIGCTDKKVNGDGTTWIDVGSAAAIKQSGSSHQHPNYPGANSTGSSTQVKEGGCEDNIPF